MKTLIPIALLLLLLIALDSPKIKKQRELLTSGYWTCSQNVYDKDKNKIGTAEGLVRYLPSGRSCTSSDLVEPFDPISKRHFSAGDFSSLTC